MMGLGIISEDHDIFENAMRISYLRGTDGTGIFQGQLGKYVNNTYLIEKQPIEVNEFFNQHNEGKINKLLLKSLQDNIFIGHTRAATKGSLSQENCHPFKVGRIIGVHNGTLNDYKYQKKDTVDSLLLYEDIANRGLKAVLEDLDPSSAYALNFVNLDEKKIYFVRNAARPLHFTYNKKRSVGYWMSREDMLKFILDYHKIDYADIQYFEPGKIYSMDIPTGVMNGSEVEFDVEEFKPRTYSKSITIYSEKEQKDYQTWWEKAYGVGWGAWGDDDPPWETQEPSKEKDHVEEHVNNLFKNNNSNVTETQTNSNVKSISLNKIKVKDGKIEHPLCIGCSRELNLLEQYNAVKVDFNGTTLYECKVCQILTKQIADDNANVTMQ